MLLSILTCHLPDRRQTLALLMRRLVPQCIEFGHCLDWDVILSILLHEQGLVFDGLNVEWLIDDTPKGVPDGSVPGGVRPVTTGEKRNKLLSRAKGHYVCAVDDDDLVAFDFISKILAAATSDPDAIGFKGMLLPRGPFSAHKPIEFIHTMDCKTWHTKDNIHWRGINHLNPVRRELALQAGFPEKNFAEDHEFSNRLAPLLKTQVMIDECMYYYYA